MPSIKDKKIAVALSGGVDSAAAAYILKKQGCNVFGIHFLNGFQPASTGIIISELSERLGIDIKTADVSEVFKTKVVDYFVKSYLDGKTPNPCMVCNFSIKFGEVLKISQNLGATCLATGHYAKIYYDKNIFHLLKGKDTKKDQSYFLARLTQKQLSSVFFPLSDITKDYAVKLAMENKLILKQEKESQDICFITDGNYKNFLKKYIKAGDGLKQIPRHIKGYIPGPIEDTAGKIIGTHKGLYSFTVGQRKGIGCPGPRPYYVAKLDVKNNRLVVGFRQDLMLSECRLKDVIWTRGRPPAKMPVKASVRIRYRSSPADCTIYSSNVIKFAKPHAGAAPGQCAVFYQNDEIIGSGWIV